MEDRKIIHQKATKRSPSMKKTRNDVFDRLSKPREFATIDYLLKNQDEVIIYF